VAQLSLECKRLLNDVLKKEDILGII
jgi:hypothetical protein